MRAILFSSQREIREYISTLNEGLIPKLYTIDDFLKRAIIVPDRVFISGSVRILYLYKAISTIDIEKLGFNKGFIPFIKNSEFIFRFFEEIYAEKKDISQDLSYIIKTLITIDTYEDYSIHLQLLSEIYNSYKSILKKEGLVDKITLNEYKLSDYFLSQFKSIEVYIDGFLSRFELSIFEQLGDTVEFKLISTPFNQKLFNRLDLKVPIDYKVRYLPSKKEIVEIKPSKHLDISKIEVTPLKDRVEQVAWILAKIDEFIKRGVNISKIAIVLPDESFVEYLKLFDTKRNFNYAMGEAFSQTTYYIQLKELYDYLSGQRVYLKQKVENSSLFKDFKNINSFDDFISFIKSFNLSERARKKVDELIFTFQRYKPLIEYEDNLKLLHSWLNELKDITIDDIGGGKITVMGLLESRGIEFDAVIIPDFNEGVVPHINDKDIFLNSYIRKNIDIPTREDKENLQKHYYYSLLRDSKNVAISYIENETKSVSRFIKELNLKIYKNLKDYMPIISPKSILKPYHNRVIDTNIFIENPKLTPTKLKDSIDCMRKVYWKYKVKIKAEDTSKSKDIGIIIHNALEVIVKNKSFINSEDEYFKAILNEIYKELDISQKFSFAIEWEDNLKLFSQRDYKNLKYNKQIKIEDWCSLKYEQYILSFKVDRVDLDEDNRQISLIDYKTGLNIEKKAKDSSDFQLLFYWLWAKKEYPDYDINIFYESLRDNKRITIDLEDKKKAFQEIISNLPTDKIIDYSMSLDIDKCRYCEYKIACERDF